MSETLPEARRRFSRPPEKKTGPETPGEAEGASTPSECVLKGPVTVVIPGLEPFVVENPTFVPEKVADEETAEYVRAEIERWEDSSRATTTEVEITGGSFEQWIKEIGSNIQNEGSEK